MPDNQMKIYRPEEKMSLTTKVFYSHAYDVKYWKKNSKTGYWEQVTDTFLADNKAAHKAVLKRWRNDADVAIRSGNIKLDPISIKYQ